MLMDGQALESFNLAMRTLVGSEIEHNGCAAEAVFHDRSLPGIFNWIVFFASRRLYLVIFSHVSSPRTVLFPLRCVPFIQ
jgi:hypothetical protein